MKNVLVKVQPISNKNVIVKSSPFQMKNVHINTVFWLSAAQSVSKVEYGNQKPLIIANTFLKSCSAVCRNQGGGLVQAPQPGTPCILPCCPIFFLGIFLRFDFWPGPRAKIIETGLFYFIRRGNGAAWSFVLLQVVHELVKYSWPSHMSLQVTADLKCWLRLIMTGSQPAAWRKWLTLEIELDFQSWHPLVPAWTWIMISRLVHMGWPSLEHQIQNLSP